MVVSSYVECRRKYVYYFICLTYTFITKCKFSRIKFWDEFNINIVRVLLCLLLFSLLFFFCHFLCLSSSFLTALSLFTVFSFLLSSLSSIFFSLLLSSLSSSLFFSLLYSQICHQHMAILCVHICRSSLFNVDYQSNLLCRW